jgi:hypothetical protein
MGYTQSQKPGNKNRIASNEAFMDHRPHLCHIQMSTGTTFRKNILAKTGREESEISTTNKQIS